MFYRYLFKNYNLKKKEEQIQSKGVSLGSRFTGTRTVYIYLLEDFFVEVSYYNDLIENGIEEIKIFNNYRQLTSYLASEEICV